MVIIDRKLNTEVVTRKRMSIPDRIFEECERMGLAIDRNHPPMKIGPDCYMLFATKLTDLCKKQGHCKQEKYYAITGCKQVKIIQ